MQISYTWRKGGTCILRIQEIPGMLILRDQRDEKWTQKRASPRFPRFPSLLYLFTSLVGLFNRKSILWNEDKGMNERTLCLPCVTHLTIREGPEKITIEDWTTKISGIRDFFFRHCLALWHASKPLTLCQICIQCCACCLPCLLLDLLVIQNLGTFLSKNESLLPLQLEQSTALCSRI